MSADLINVRDNLTFDIDSLFEITACSKRPEVSRCQNILDSISDNMINAIESKQYSLLNIIGCRDGENDQKSSHSKTDFEIQDNVNNKFDVSIEEIEQKTLNIMKCLNDENDQKSSHLSLNIIECIDGENNQKSLHSQADLEFQNYVDNEFDVSIEEIEPTINISYILFVEQKQILKRLIIKYKPVFLKKAGVNE